MGNVERTIERVGRIISPLNVVLIFLIKPPQLSYNVDSAYARYM